MPNSEGERRNRRHVINTAMLMAIAMGGFRADEYRSGGVSVGPDPHVCDEEEGQTIARQIAAQRKAKRKYRRSHAE